MKLFRLSYVALVLFGGVLFGEEISPLSEYTLDDTTLPLYQMERGKINYIIHIKEGDVIPIQFNLSGDILTFKEQPHGGEIIALQSCFIKHVNGEFSFSLDKVIWKSFNDFIGGEIKASIGADDSQRIVGSLSLEHHLK